MVLVDPPSSWRPLLVPALIVAVGLAVAWLLFAHFGQSKPDAIGSIVQQVVYPVQVNQEETQADPGMGGVPQAQNETIVLVVARVTNIGPKPLTIFDMVSEVKLDDATNQSIDALPEDMDRLFQRFPDLAAMNGAPLARRQVIQPGQSAQGLMVFNYAWSQQQWNRSKDRRIVVSFQDGRPVSIPLN